MTPLEQCLRMPWQYREMLGIVDLSNWQVKHGLPWSDSLELGLPKTDSMDDVEDRILTHPASEVTITLRFQAGLIGGHPALYRMAHVRQSDSWATPAKIRGRRTSWNQARDLMLAIHAGGTR